MVARVAHPTLPPNTPAPSQALKSVLATASLDYDYHVYRVPFPVDAPATVLTAGAASLFRASVALAVPLRPAPPPAPVPAAELDAARALLDAARAAEFSVDGAAEWLEPALVAARRGASSPAASEADLHRLLVQARLLALSHGEAALTRARWEGALALDAARRARLAA